MDNVQKRPDCLLKKVMQPSENHRLSETNPYPWSRVSLKPQFSIVTDCYIMLLLSTASCHVKDKCDRLTVIMTRHDRVSMALCVYVVFYFLFYFFLVKGRPQLQFNFNFKIIL